MSRASAMLRRLGRAFRGGGRRRMRWLTGTLALAAAATAPAADTVVVLDGSGSMWGRVEGEPKIVIAREVMREIIADWPVDQRLGLVAYGHRRKGDCGDIETLQAPAPLDRAAFVERFDAVSPKGKTPLTDAVEHAARELRFTEGAATVVLLSDGIETCHRDPCEAAVALERSGVDFTAHVIGFDVKREADQAQLRCLADETGGRFLTADSANELKEALASVQAAATQPEAEPEPAPEVSVEAPAQVVVGERFAVEWEPTVAGGDFITIVPSDADAQRIANHARARRGSPARLRAPQEPGTYEVRYVRTAGKKVLGRTVVKLVDARVELDVPDEVTVGTEFDVSYEPTIDEDDYVTVVPADAPDDEIGEHVRAGTGSPTPLRAPGKPGAYEVRYVLAEGDRTVARAPLEVTAARVAVSAPDTGVAGGTTHVEWDRALDGGDFLTIVPVDAPPDEIGNHFRAGDERAGTLRNPGEPGLYEVRYVLDEGRHVLGRSRIELTSPQVSISAPDKATAGSEIEVSWRGTVHRGDFVTIVPADAPDDEVGNHRRAQDDETGELRVPGRPGRYEVRYVLDEGRRTLARAPVEVIEPRVSIEAPEKAMAGSGIEVSWQGAVHRGDFITIVPADAPEDEVGNHRRTGDEETGALRVPGTAGHYEVRYVLEEGRRTLARAAVEATEPDVQLDTPARVQAGKPVDVSWEPTIHRGDLITIVAADAPGDEIGNHRRAGDGNTVAVPAPDEPGRYEVRYVLDEGRRPIARAPLEVTAP